MLWWLLSCKEKTCAYGCVMIFPILIGENEINDRHNYIGLAGSIINFLNMYLGTTNPQWLMILQQNLLDITFNEALDYFQRRWSRTV